MSPYEVYRLFICRKSSESHCLVIRCTTMLWQYTLINPHQVGILLYREEANNNILNATPIRRGIKFKPISEDEKY